MGMTAALEPAAPPSTAPPAPALVAGWVDALPRLAAALRPGGRLIAVALPRVELPRELPVEVAAVGAQVAVAVALGLVRRAGVPVLVKQDEGMPVVAPELTVHQVRRQAQSVLPGAQVRRLLFWRYLLQWDRPTM